MQVQQKYRHLTQQDWTGSAPLRWAHIQGLIPEKKNKKKYQISQDVLLCVNTRCSAPAFRPNDTHTRCLIKESSNHTHSRAATGTLELVVNHQNRHNFVESTEHNTFEAIYLVFSSEKLSWALLWNYYRLVLIAAIDQARKWTVILRLPKSNKACHGPLNIKPQFESFCTFIWREIFAGSIECSFPWVNGGRWQERQERGFLSETRTALGGASHRLKGTVDGWAGFNHL